MVNRSTKFSNDTGRLVIEMLEGWVMANPSRIALNSDGHVIRATPKAEGGVALVIGNGTGHEPAMVGFVGRGLMDLNVAGPVFAAPSAAELVKGILGADRGGGVLLCVSNHEGDVLAADLAIELLEDEADAPEVRVAVLGEDIGTAFEHRSQRRGGAGLLFVWKLLGAYAEGGHTLDECHALALRVADRCASLSATMTSGSHPVSGATLAEIPEGHVLLGSGVHGEGTNAVPLGSVDDLIRQMIDLLLADAVVGQSKRLALVVNNSGSLTGMELGIVARSARLELESRSIAVERTWFGRYATTQEAAGFVLALCAVDSEFLALYDAPADGPSWSYSPDLTRGSDE